MGKLFTILFELSLTSLFIFSACYSENVKLRYRSFEFRYKKVILINLLVSVIVFIIRIIIIPFNTNNIVASFADLFMYTTYVFLLMAIVSVINFISKYQTTKRYNKGYLFLSTASLIAFISCMCLATSLNSKASSYHHHTANTKQVVHAHKHKKETYLKQLSTTNKKGIVDGSGKITYVYETDKDAKITTDADDNEAAISKISDTKYQITFTLKHKDSDYIEIDADKKGQSEGSDIVDIYTQKGYDKENSDDDSDSSSKKSSSSSSSSDDSEGKVPAEYKEALDTGEGYANYEHLSKQGVYDQLTSSSEDYSSAAASYAINHMNDVDWNYNALQEAKDYRSLMHMSPSDIQDQLSSQDGDKFTPDQAAYAIQHLDD